MAAVALVVVAVGLRIGVPIYRKQAAIREITRLRGKVRQVACGPEWLRKRIGEERMKMVDEVDRVDFSSTQVTDAGISALERLTGLPRLR